MKRIRLFAAIGGGILLLLVILLLTTCRRDRQPADGGDTTVPETTGEVTSGQGGTEGDTRPSPDTEPTPSESQTERETEAATPHQTETESETQPEPPAPVPLTAEEARALLSAALGKVLDQVAVTVKTELGGEEISLESFARKGEDFFMESRSDGVTEGVTVVGSRAYYLLLIPKDFPPVEKRLVTSLTNKERQDLFARYVQYDGLPLIEDETLIQGILNGTLEGLRYSDGRVELTCRGLDGRLGEGLFGMSLEGSSLQVSVSLDRDVRVTLLRGTAYRSGGATISVEMQVNYTPDAIGLPADAAGYIPTTYADIFVTQPPEADPEAAAAAGMPLDRQQYTLIGGNYLYDPSEQYEFLIHYPHSYTGKTFILYGVLTGGDGGKTLLSLGSGMELSVTFDKGALPVDGSYVKLTATYRKVGEGLDHTAYAMAVSACEVLEVAKGPSGGKLMYVTSAGLNVRTSSDVSVSDNVIGTYSKGDLVEVFEQDGNGWYRVVYNGRNGYVNGKYLSETRP